VLESQNEDFTRSAPSFGAPQSHPALGKSFVRQLSRPSLFLPSAKHPLHATRIILHQRNFILRHPTHPLAPRTLTLSLSHFIPHRSRTISLCINLPPSSNGTTRQACSQTLRRRNLPSHPDPAIPRPINPRLHRITTSLPTPAPHPFLLPTRQPPLTMATWNNATWNSGILWGPASPQPPSTTNQIKHKRSTMKRQPYFPRTVAARPEWFGNFATQLPIANAELGLDATEVTDIVKDAKFCEYACGPWLTAVREFGPASTAAIDTLFDSPGSTPFVLPAFTVPPLPASVTPVPPGALARIAVFVRAIKARPGYTENIGLQLRIVGQEDAAIRDLPEFKVTLERGGAVGSCQCVRIAFKKFGRQGVVIHSRRGGAEWQMLAIDLASPYLDERPLLSPGTPEIREYRLQFYDDAAPVGEFTDIATVTVTP
jgi:hypothetical protein